ncbi:hypothetical protein HPB47_005152 [Ixodes persulcatus]|uniref:Uncharacterized protein n=1 Tax=Ixodes persulcatus TaxID=34615 RepID=A0AC60PDU4_IXOPE|nr:hypothetical protein HPB47_005152 [Ixodes persulcatus]
MTSGKFLEWLGRIWGPNVDDVRRLLVLDQAPVHKTLAANDSIQERDTDRVYVPVGCTSLLQPADVLWKKPFKAKEKTAKGNFRKPSRQYVPEFVSKAWASAPEGTVAPDIGTVVPENPDELRNECVDLILGSESEGSFDGIRQRLE